MTITNATVAPRQGITDIPRLRQALIDARARTHTLIEDLTDEQLLGPKLTIVNPPLWELGHLGWFQERWCLRLRDEQDALAPSVMPKADALYDSAAVAHDDRWNLPLPNLNATLKYLECVLDAVLERVERKATPHTCYFAELAAAHEEMHCEAFTYTRQTLAYPAPRSPRQQMDLDAGPDAGDANIPGGEFALGADAAGAFAFDNEKWSHRVRVAPFRISRAVVTNEQFAGFVNDGGYVRRELWSDAGWVWRQAAGALHPVYWQKADGVWLQRRYDRTERIAARGPVIHVNWHEAQAYCRWSGRRLPTEAEWEYAASASRDGARKRKWPWGNVPPDALHANFYGVRGAPADVGAFAAGDSPWGCRQMMGNVWEWTADTFAPYPGFIRDPYKEYSEPWFGTHKVLRGGAFATRAWLMRNTWRNFYTPDRRDIYAGFRTCAASESSAHESRA